MDELKFNPDRGFTVMMFFLQGVWETVKGEFFVSSGEWGDFGDFVSCLFNDLATFDDWERCCQKALGRFPSKDQLFTPEEIFTSFIELCAFYRYYFDFSIPEVLELLHSMRANPDKHQKEWDIWNATIQRELEWRRKQGEFWKPQSLEDLEKR